MKVIYDTCVYIDFLRRGQHKSFFETAFHIRFLSAVVIMELNAGAINSRQNRTLEQLYYPYSKAGRILNPNTSHFFKTGEIISKLRKLNGSVKKGLSHDILIALSAYSVGATLYTTNKIDFELIKKYVPLKLEVL